MVMAVSYSLLLGGAASLGIAALFLFLALHHPRGGLSTYEQITFFGSAAMLLVLAVAFIVGGLAK